MSICHRGAGPSISTTPNATTRNRPGHGHPCGNPEQHRPAQSGHDCSGAHYRLSSMFKHSCKSRRGQAYENPADSCDTGAWYLWAPGGRGDANIISVNYLLHVPDIW